MRHDVIVACCRFHGFLKLPMLWCQELSANAEEWGEVREQKTRELSLAKRTLFLIARQEFQGDVENPDVI